MNRENRDAAILLSILLIVIIPEDANRKFHRNIREVNIEMRLEKRRINTRRDRLADFTHRSSCPVNSR
jgi:hypothetical protein